MRAALLWVTVQRIVPSASAFRHSIAILWLVLLLFSAALSCTSVQPSG